jgi:hypothetical protein
MSLLRKQYIIETHEEHLVERIRFRVVTDPTNTVLNIRRFGFLNKKTGPTTYRNVPLTRYGAIEDWPEDFFHQSQKETERIVIKGYGASQIGTEPIAAQSEMITHILLDPGVFWLLDPDDQTESETEIL